jgi:hypothetical protein
VEVLKGVLVAVGRLVGVAVLVGVGEGPTVAVFVGVPVGVFVPVAVEVLVAVAVAVGVPVLVGVAVGPEANVSTSCGGEVPSREWKEAPSVLSGNTAKLYVPLPVTADVKLNSAQVLAVMAATLDTAPLVAPGRLFQVIAVSVQVLLVR